MRALKYNQLAFERQLCETVEIQYVRKQHILLNSKSEYNRCALPRLGLKMGEAEFKEKRKEDEEEKKREEDIENKIKEMKKERAKWRRRIPRNQPDRKRMRMEDGEKAVCLQEKRSEEEKDRGEKRELELEGKEIDGWRKKKKRRMLQSDISSYITTSNVAVLEEGGVELHGVTGRASNKSSRIIPGRQDELCPEMKIAIPPETPKAIKRAPNEILVGAIEKVEKDNTEDILSESASRSQLLLDMGDPGCGYIPEEMGRLTPVIIEEAPTIKLVGAFYEKDTEKDVLSQKQETRKISEEMRK